MMLLCQILVGPLEEVVHTTSSSVRIEAAVFGLLSVTADLLGAVDSGNNILMLVGIFYRCASELVPCLS